MELGLEIGPSLGSWSGRGRRNEMESINGCVNRRGKGDMLAG
jgi:hypothetical protein